jgi:hypothetical protein
VNPFGKQKLEIGNSKLENASDCQFPISSFYLFYVAAAPLTTSMISRVIAA